MPQCKTYKIGISGHRKLADEQKVRQEINLLLVERKKIHSNIIAISALAEGVDSIFVEEALKLDIPFEAILPFPVKDYQNTFSDQEKIDRLNELLLKASKVKSILDHKPDNQEARRQGYLDSGTRVVDESDFMLFVYDGEKASGKGGTGDIYEYAEKISKPNYLIIAKKNHK